jgi:hypothetical protein
MSFTGWQRTFNSLEMLAKKHRHCYFNFGLNRNFPILSINDRVVVSIHHTETFPQDEIEAWRIMESVLQEGIKYLYWVNLFQQKCTREHALHC